MTYSVKLNTAYRPSDTSADSIFLHDQEFEQGALYTLRRTRTDQFKEEVAEIMGELTMEEYMTITRKDYDSRINEKGRIELKGHFLLKLHDNTISGTNGEDAVEHIENFLKIVDLLNVPNILMIDLGRGDDEEVMTDNELSNARDDSLTEENEIAQIFRIDTDIFHFKTPLFEAFMEFNYLSQTNVDVLIKDIPRFKTYEEYKDDWIY
ncbi:hypothetical protein Tco_0581609 [Tanacetum coccineum]